MSILRPLVEEFTVEPFCSSTIVRYTLQPPGEGDNVFERGFIRLDTNNQRGLGQVLSVAGYTEHETGSIIFPGIVSIGMSTITHEARGPPTVDLRNIDSPFKFRYEYGDRATFFHLPSEQLRRGVLTLCFFSYARYRCQITVALGVALSSPLPIEYIPGEGFAVCDSDCEYPDCIHVTKAKRQF